MRVIDQDPLFRVIANEKDIREFCMNWPASGLRPVHSVSATFKKKNGEVVDITVNRRHTHKYEGQALTALIGNMQKAGEAKFKKPRARQRLRQLHGALLLRSRQRSRRCR